MSISMKQENGYIEHSKMIPKTEVISLEFYRIEAMQENCSPNQKNMEYRENLYSQVRFMIKI